MKDIVTRADLENWLERYGKAWEQGDPDAIVELFSEDATYRETPFDEALRGRDQIWQYWKDGAADGQEEVAFQSKAWGVSGNQGFAGWQAQFRRVGSGALVELGGAFRLLFEEVNGELKCCSLEEWWHRRETAASA